MGRAGRGGRLLAEWVPDLVGHVLALLDPEAVF
jgi:hypothetical protein